MSECSETRTGRHDASQDIETVEKETSPDKYETLAPDRLDYAGDPRWPTQCICGKRFGVDVQYQVNDDRLYDSPDGQVTWREAAVGAIMDAFWMPWKGPDGLSLLAKCPDGGDWHIDGPSSSCKLHSHEASERSCCWTRTGEVPNITVSPSIDTGTYHGFLQNGIFTDPI
jgi:hypothetical protein